MNVFYSKKQDNSAYAKIGLQAGAGMQGCRDAGIDNQAEDGKAMCDFFGTYTEQSETKAETAIDFFNFAPNAPEEVRQAFMEAAENREQYDKVMEFINGTNKLPEKGK